MKIQEHHDRILRQTMNFLNGSSQNDSVLSKAFSATHLRESNKKWVAAFPSLAYWDLHFDSINYTREVNDLFPKMGHQTYPESFQPFQDLRPKRGIIGGRDELNHG